VRKILNRAVRVAGLAVLIVVGLVGGHESNVDAQVVSPGKLSDAHSKFDGSQNCTKCHARRGRVEPERCLACHKVLKARVAERKGYHANLGAARCGKCHQDHRGRDFKVVRWPGGIDSFRHLGLGFALRDAHGEKKCRDCHKPKFQVDSAVRAFDTSRRKQTYLGLTKTCKSCHEDEHEGRLGDACETCHGEKTFKKPPFFDHAKSDYPLLGAHSKVECAKCHTKKGRKPETLYEGIAFDACTDCHEDQHSGVMTKPRNAPAAPTRTCKSCHSESDWKKSRYDKGEHSPKRFALAGGHKKPACAKCHAVKIDKMPGPACQGCHEDVHAGRFGTSCTQCHDSGSWRARIRTSRAVPESLARSEKRLGITAK